MDANPPAYLSARKEARQTRSRITIDVIFEATVQVLIADGVKRLTTTRVAQRAGVSVGTIYQYFPHKQALLYALNERYLDRLAQRVENTCRTHHGAATSAMVEALVTVYWDAKTERSEVTRALYSSTAEFDNSALISAFAARMDAATAAMFNSASDARGPGLSITNLTLLAVVFGTVRNVFERNLEPSRQTDIRRQLITMCVAYLHVSNNPLQEARHVK